MNKRVLALIIIAICVYLDSILFARVHFYLIRPDAMLAATISFAILTGPYSGAAFGAVGGLWMDFLFGPALGASACLYLLCGLCAGYFYRKFYADNLFVPAGAAFVLSAAKELIYAVATLIRGGSFSFSGMLIKYILPSAILSALLCIFFHVCIKRLVTKQVKRSRRLHG